MKTKEQVERRLITLEEALEHAKRINLSEEELEQIRIKINLLVWVLSE